ncbi:MAG TPA: hypothetical protein PKW21_12425 [Rhabdaerophilum sp.]|nr:hypothetical protein [Rhabdaerophilum sp.]
MTILTISTIGPLICQLQLFEDATSFEFRQLCRAADEAVLDDNSLQDLSKWLDIAQEIGDNFEISNLRSRLDKFRRLLNSSPSESRLNHEIREIKSAIVEGLRGHFLYKYDRIGLELMKEQKEIWENISKYINGIEYDAHECLHCFSLGRYTASIFHAMRVLERGLVYLSKAIKVESDKNNWGNLIDRIEKSIRDVKTQKNSPEKEIQIQRLSELAKEFTYFKDAWRNWCAHGNRNYDRKDALKVLTHTRDFMQTLSGLNDENC